MNYNNKIAITTGDINGIGMEITVKALNSLNIPEDKIVLITNKSILKQNYKLNKNYEIIDIYYEGKIEYGKITANSGNFAFNSIKKACEIRPKAIVTAPVSKEALHIAGHKFNGQTEILEYYLGKNNQKAEMLFVSNGFNVLLLTRHCALKDIYIDKDIIVEKILRLNTFLKTHYKIKTPKLALCSLNPHAGEGGILGKEEINIIIPAVNILKEKGIKITEPQPSDTLFIKAGQNYIQGKKAPFDCYIAMYHDQGLIPIKTIACEKTVNMTIGLDIIRTSPSHGTAFDIAGKNKANPNSMIAAIKEVL
jgi:4-hydroxythreonine-4-phosphate dehydrogenase